MEWRNPELVNLNNCGGDGTKCKPGGGATGCSFGGETNYIECWPGGVMPTPGCIFGGKEDL